MGLDTVELVMEVEEAFCIRIPDDMAASAETAGDLFERVVLLLSADPRWANLRHCLSCEYPLRGLDVGRCPECGREFTMPGDIDREKVWRQLVLIVGEQAGVDPSRIKATSRFVRDLHMD